MRSLSFSKEFPRAGAVWFHTQVRRLCTGRPTCRLCECRVGPVEVTRSSESGRFGTSETPSIAGGIIPLGRSRLSGMM